MKKITFFACLLAFAFVNAQDGDKNSSDKLTFAKGSQFINLNLSVNTSTSDFEGTTQTQEAKNFGFNINPSYSYAISDNFFLGLGLGYGHNKRENEINGAADNEATTNSFQIFPYVRYYKGIGKKLAFFVQGETRYTNSKNEVNNQDARETNTLFFGVRPGFVFMLNKNLGLETSIGALGYTTSNTDDLANNSEIDTNSFNFSLNSSNLLFGLSYYF
ncbi:outer membrane beta-barrel protein [Kordia algicida OT-1]|uniref:Outer membrane protein beta-barrel domain-containing protein n=1 Tax=Kordia algicida OT-1 TaxID=391587 RepID=A9DNA7_9FLAO|nr:outer membrane beta-barrel protein [Kordia algicida]EDP97148.1 hypothetical protein KAOT1_18337 [Kordia algicida OT-1]